MLRRRGGVNGGSPMVAAMRLRVWLLSLSCCVLAWVCLLQLLAMADLSRLRLLKPWGAGDGEVAALVPPPPLPTTTIRVLPSPRNYTSNGYLKVSCNGGLNQMRSAICDMVAVSRLLNLTMVVPELDKLSFWADPSGFADIFDVNHFIDSLRDEVRIVQRLPKKLTQNNASSLSMPPVSWSNESYYLNQILPLFNRYKVIHFNKTDTRLANNGLSIELQKLRCRVNYNALKFTEQIELLGSKLVQVLAQKGPFLALHLRYEMDMLAFSGCTHGCTEEETEELKKLRYAYPWWREKEIVSELKRLKGLCPLTPEETTLVLKALGYGNETRIYIASGEIYGSERRLRDLHNMFPLIVRKETLLDSKELELFHHHSSQMAALDYMVSIASDTFIPTFDGNMAKVVEGHRRYLGYRKTVVLNRKKLVELLDMHQNNTITWEEFAASVQEMHKVRLGQPTPRTVFADKPKEEDYFYSNPTECLEKNALQRHSQEQRLRTVIVS